MNIIVENGNILPTDQATLFADEEVLRVPGTFNLTDLVCHLGLYKSKSQARQANRVGEIPTGYTEFKGNKKTPLYVWNPTE
ncbi:hypothetical protein KVP40.0283 [Vibrio phage KVP40]|uniref:Uncharacterized protein n=4 Tax=Schizotequatrovirus KVP40 TaxID=1914019 RepID=Q6WHM0_BPKVM|nr:hypothetical protein KVP40.0283 [Vibrio phage KVP40]AFN37514.1 hypothetical protein pp2_281 [Vibrio phage phi-pp2]QHJ74462.1 hypothetical protein VH12019_00135 [Vibrio phage VH1_2019]QIW90143.1 hypothetical protein OLCHANIL_00046 [Vibrio phage V05]QIW91131.1 hypothetical protein COHAPHLL_00295 [Vibrio phage V09]UNA01797.1 hypothetical protein [Vibrio phage PC-Liy1]URQ03093.1 hypothetical protein PVA8_107 [Vibrio phage PVA8]WBM58829.1 hypothetical protein vBValMPVA8_107 [Vibrio phage vB_Va